MTVIRVRCSPEHARELAKRMIALGEIEVAAALGALAMDVEGYRKALVEHHNISNVSDEVLARYDWRECPVCKEARGG